MKNAMFVSVCAHMYENQRSVLGVVPQVLSILVFEIMSCIILKLAG